MVGFSVLVIFAPIVLGASPVRLISESTCPDEARISAELEAIVSLREGAPEPSDVARVTTRAGELVVTLTGADGALLGERRLRDEGDCDAKARAVAVILATFLTDLHPEYVTLLPAPTPDSDAGRAGVATTPAPAAQQPTAAEPPPPAPPAPSPAPARSEPKPARDAVPVPAPAHRRDEWLLAAAVGAELNSALVPAAALSLSFVPGGRGLGARAFALVAGGAERTVGGSVASYSRHPLGVGPLVRFGRPDAWFDAGAGVTFGWLRVEGLTFASNLSADDLVVGAFLGARAGMEWLGFRPFAELGVLGWPGKSTLISRTPAASATLPAFDANFLLGVGLPL